jgi:hypothetical protein
LQDIVAQQELSNHPDLIIHEGDYVYAIGALGEILVIDVSDQSAPSVIGELDLDTTQWDGMEYASGYLYVWSANNGFWIIDVRDPAQPTFVSWTDEYSDLHEIAVTDDHLALARDSINGTDIDGVEIYSIEDPESPELLSFIEGYRNPDLFSMTDDLIVIIDWRDEYYNLEIYDISDATNPVSTADVVLVGQSELMSIHGDTLCIYTLDNSLQIYNIAQPSNPILVGQTSFADEFDGARDIMQVRAVDDRVYLSTKATDLIVVDIRTPSSPSTIGWYEIPTSFYSLAAKDTKVYGLGSDQLWIMDTTTPVSRPYRWLLEGLDLSSHVSNVLVYNDYLLVSGSSIPTFVFDNLHLEDPEVVALASIRIDNSTLIDNDFLYAAEFREGIGVYDMSRIDFITRIELLDLPEEVYELQKQGDFLYANTRQNEFYIIDARDEYDLQLLGSYALDDSITQLLADGNLLYVGTQRELVVLNMSLPILPSRVTAVAHNPAVISIAIMDQSLYTLTTTTSSSEIRVFDINNPSAPIEIGQIEFPYRGSSLKSGPDGILYMHTTQQGATAINMSDPSAPVLEKHFSSFQGGYNMAVTETAAYISDGSRGVLVVDITRDCPACRADIDASGVADVFDVFIFLEYFTVGDHRAEFNGDGVLDIFDVFAYLDAFEQCASPRSGSDR